MNGSGTPGDKCLEAPHLIAAGAVAAALRLKQRRIEYQPVAIGAHCRTTPGRALVADVVQRARIVVAVARGGRMKPAEQPLCMTPGPEPRREPCQVPRAPK